MGIEIESTETASRKGSQEAIEPSARACTKVLDELSKDMPSGKPLLSLVQPGLNPDLSSYLLKQPNESGGNPHADVSLDSMIIGDFRPGLYGQRTESPEERLRTGSGAMRDKPPYFAMMQSIFGNSQYFDLVRNHNQVLSEPGGRTLFDYIKRIEQGATADATRVVSANPGESTTLINFDAHSDVYLDDPGKTSKDKASIAQWVNGMLLKNPNINEVYWVLPDNFKTDPALRQHYFDHKGAPIDPVMVQSGPDVELYLNKKTGELTAGTKPKDFSEETHRTIQFHKRTIDELPNMKGKRIAASIDLDYFDNRGYDTTVHASTPWAGDAGFQKFVQALHDKGIQPIHTSVSASPEYVRSENMRDLLRFSTLVADASKPKMDAVVVPKEHSIYNELGLKHSGIQVNRDSKSLRLMYELFKNDSMTAKPDDALNLRESSDELTKGIEATKRIFGVGEEKGKEILARLDKMDGKEDGVLEFESIEMLLNRLCQVKPTGGMKKDYSR